MWAVVPVKVLANCKARLAGRLAAPQRAGLMRAMLKDVVRELCRVESLSGVGLLSSDEAIAAFARQRGLRTWNDRGDDVNRSLEIVARELFAADDSVIIVPADLPTATAADYRELLSTRAPGLTLVPSCDGGTNIIAADPGTLIPLSFGPDSLRIHQATARERRVPVSVVEVAAFRRDIDRPEDLDWLAAADSDCDARRWLLERQGLMTAGHRRRTA